MLNNQSLFDLSNHDIPTVGYVGKYLGDIVGLLIVDGWANSIVGLDK